MERANGWLIIEQRPFWGNGSPVYGIFDSFQSPKHCEFPTLDNARAWTSANPNVRRVG